MDMPGKEIMLSTGQTVAKTDMHDDGIVHSGFSPLQYMTRYSRFSTAVNSMMPTSQ